jgi:hypothetical protein
MVVSGDDGGDVLGRDAVQVQVNLLRAFDRGTRLQERLGGPHRIEVTPGAGRAWAVVRCRRHMTQALARTASPNGGTCPRGYSAQSA